jgi:serine/threonine-protein kinase RsbW
VTREAPNVRLELSSKPECISLVRGMLAGIAEPLAFDAELLDDLKTAVSEACNNVVLHAYGGEPGKLVVDLGVERDSVQVVVRDWGDGIRSLARTEDRMHVGLALISALADRAEFLGPDDGGTEVRMVFSRSGATAPASDESESLGEVDEWHQRLSGDVIVTLSPVNLLSGVLGRLARALAADARFTLDRFSDLYMVTDAVAAHAANSATSAQIGFALHAEQRRLMMMIGPFTPGAGRQLQESSSDRQSLLPLLADELSVERTNHAELLRLVMQDHQTDAATA